MFGKKKKAQAAARRAAADFTRRPGYESTRAAEYELYSGLRQDILLPKLEAHLKELFSGEVDDGNGDLLDGLILAPAREAAQELARQKYDHEDAIRRIIARRDADREDFGKILALRQQEMTALEAMHEKTLRLMAEANGEE